VLLTLKVKVLASGEVYWENLNFSSSRLPPTQINCYLPPSTDLQRLDFSEFENTLLEFFTDYSNLVVFGDFNANLCTSTYDSVHLREFLNFSNLYLVPYDPTYQLENSSTWLDVCAVNDAEKLIGFGQRDVSFLSAHDLVFIEYNVSVERNTVRQVTARDYRNFDYDRFTSLSAAGARLLRRTASTQRSKFLTAFLLKPWTSTLRFALSLHTGIP